MYKIFMLWGFCIGQVVAQTSPLTLSDAVQQALQSDPGLKSSHHREVARFAQAEADSRLANPKLSLSMQNLATDSFDINQEAMTQFKLGLSQQFSRGDELALKRRQWQQLGEQEPFIREARRGEITRQIRETYLQAFKASRSMTLIEQDKALFEQLVEVAQANYASGSGQARQQDLLRAQLELARLDDRLVALEQTRQGALNTLMLWLEPTVLLRPMVETLPEITPLYQQTMNNEVFYTLLSRHPQIKAMDKQLSMRDTQVKLAEQAYKPAWGVNASYGFRGDEPMGSSRADLFSVGVTLDMPLFSAVRQDKQKDAAIATRAATQTDRLLLLKQMHANLQSLLAQKRNLDRRAALFNQTLLPQTAEQAQAALNAYTHDVGDFAEVMRARIAELNTKLDALAIAVDQQILTAKVNYLLLGA